MISYLFILLSYSFSQAQNEKSEHNVYVCFQAGNALCPKDQNYQVFYESQKLTNHLLNNINNQEDILNIFVANTKQEILFLNCSLLPNKVNIYGYPDSYAEIDFQYGYNSDKSKRNQIVTVKNLKVKSVRSELKKDQNKIKAMFLKLEDVTFLNQQPLKIKAKEINATFNSLQKVSKLHGSKIVKLSGLPKNVNNQDLSLTAKIEADNLILDSFNDNASIDFIEKDKSYELTALLQFSSFKNSVITLSSEKYNIFLNYETYLTFYYDSPDHSKIVSLSKDSSTKVNINVESENAHVLFSSDKWSSKKVHKGHHINNHKYNSINFDLTCSSNVVVESSAHHLPLNVNSCQNPRLIFNDESASIDSLELTNQGKAVIENHKNGGEVTINHHITFSPGAHLQALDSVSKIRTPRVKSSSQSQSASQMTVSGHFEIESGEFEFQDYSVSFEYPPFSTTQTKKGRIPSFVVPANRNSIQPIEIQKPTAGSRLNIRISRNFLTGKLNNQIKEQIIGKTINLFANMKVADFTLYFGKQGLNDQQKNLVSLQQNGQFVSLQVSDLPSRYSSVICLFKENDDESRELCERENLIPFQVSNPSNQNSYYTKISELTEHKSDVSIYVSSSSDITLNLDDLESAKIQSINGQKLSSVTIDNKNSQKTVKSLSLSNIEVSFSDKSLHYDRLTLDRGSKILDSKKVSFSNVNKLNADVTVLKDIPKTRMKTNSVIFGNIVQTIKFLDNGFLFQLIHDNEFEIDAEDYNEIDYPFIFNESNITLIKGVDKPSHFVLPLHYSDFNNNNNYIIVDSSFGNDNSVLDIKIDAKKVRLLTYSTVIPFQFSDDISLIEIGLGQYDNVRAIDFCSDLEIEKSSTLTIAPLSDETDSQLKKKFIHINFNEIEMKDKSTLVSGSESILFTKISIDEDASVSLLGVTGNGPLEAEGIDNIIEIKSNPKTGHPSNFGSSIFSYKVENDLYTTINAHNSPQNSPLFKFDLRSIVNSVKSIKIHFEKFDRSIASFNSTVKVLDLIDVDQSFESFRCKNIASKVSFDPDTLTRKDESIRFSATCDSENKVVVLGEIHLDSKDSTPTRSPTQPPTKLPTPSQSPQKPGDGDGTGDGTGGDGDDDDGDTGINHSSKKKRNRIIAIACACGSAVIIVAVAVAVALYLRKHYREGDSERAQMMAHLDPNNEQNNVII